MRFLLFFLLLIGCSPLNKNIVNKKIDPNGIVYILPGTVQNILLSQNLSEKTFFVLCKIDELNFRLYIQHADDESKWVKNTNRYLSVAGDLYPLLFDYDNFFANSETAIEFMDNQQKGDYKRTIVTVTRDNVHHIDFNVRGDILFKSW